MSFVVENWLEELVQKILDTFNERVKFIGLQGSYRRQEATDQSDIDVVFILDRLDQEDIRQYKQIIESMPYSEKACGFISGMKEIYHWPKHDSFQLYYDTKALYGDLRQLLPPFDRKDVLDAIRIGASNLYHDALHTYLYDGVTFSDLKRLYKTSFFILQAIYFLKNQKYIGTKQELLTRLDGEDKKILEICMGLDEKDEQMDQELELYFERLVNWSSSVFTLAEQKRHHTPKRISYTAKPYFQKKTKNYFPRINGK